MSPREINGLQALAKANGGTLTINPETGLPEAGFLEDILPVVAMAAATYFTAGAAAPAIAGALGSAGLGTAAATTAGGIIGGGLAGAGVGAIGAGIQGKDVGQGALMGGLGGALSGGMGAYDNVFSAVDAANAGNLAQANQAAVSAPTNVSDVYSGLAGQPSVPPGTMPSPTLQPGATVSGTAAAQLPEGAARNAALDALVESNRAFPEGASQLGGPGLTEAPSKLANAQEIVRPDSYYQKAGLMGKTATLAAPGIGGAMAEDPYNYEFPGKEPYRNKSTLSADFQGYTPPQPNPYYRAQYARYAASGGLMDAYQAGGPVERMSQMNTAMNPQGGLYPQGMIDKTQYAVPTQRPVSSELVMNDSAYERSNPMLMNTGGLSSRKESGVSESSISSMDPYNAGIARLKNAMASAQMPKKVAKNLAVRQELGDITLASGGISSLGGYSDGGRMLKGPGDGMSDSIPGVIGNKQPARLADGEFVVPADVVSHLGNGSTDAGARKLYSMMDKIRKARTGKKKQAPAVNTGRFMPA
jgi:hypothetical protein